jgi:hypothetical protein
MSLRVTMKMAAQRGQVTLSSVRSVKISSMSFSPKGERAGRTRSKVQPQS